MAAGNDRVGEQPDQDLEMEDGQGYEPPRVAELGSFEGLTRGTGGGAGDPTTSSVE